MSPDEIASLTPGTVYLVRIKGHPRRTRRILKGTEMRRWPIRIPCAVFTTEVRRDTTARWDPRTQTLSLSGRVIPAGEYSIPHYELLSCTPAPHTS